MNENPLNENPFEVKYLTHTVRFSLLRFPLTREMEVDLDFQKNANISGTRTGTKKPKTWLEPL